MKNRTPLRITKVKRKPKSKPRRKYGFPGLTISAWAIGLGSNPQTLEKSFRKQGIEVVPRKLYGIREFATALTGDLHAAQVRKTELEAKKLEREEKQASGELVPWELVGEMFNRLIVSPHTSICDAETDPVVREFIEKRLKPLMRVKLEPPKPEQK